MIGVVRPSKCPPHDESAEREPEGERRPDIRVTARHRGTSASPIQGDAWGSLKSRDMTSKLVNRIDRDEGFDPPPPIIRVRRRRDDDGDGSPGELSA